MRAKASVLTISVLGILASCSGATATTIDPENDMHCSALAYYFHAAAEQAQVGEEQKRSAKILHEWYLRKLSRAVKNHQVTPEVKLKLERIILDAKEAPTSVAKEHVECARRAVNSSDFEPFTRSMGVTVTGTLR